MLMRSVLLLVFVSLFATAASAEIYRWVDEDGKVHYGDRVPAKYAKGEQQTLNKQGLELERREREKTEEERARAEQEAAAKKAAEARDAEQARYDNFLLSTYPTVGALERARDDRLAIMDGQVRNAEKSKVEALDALQVLERRADSYLQNNKPVPEKLQSQIRAFRTTYDEATRRIGTVQTERENVASQFESDRARLAEILESPDSGTPD